MRTALLLTAIFTSTFACGASHPEVYDQFKEYRIALSEDQRTTYTYFTRRYLTEWLDSIMYVRTVSLLKHLEIIWDDLLVGSVIEVVHSYDVTAEPDGRWLLTLTYSNQITDELRKMGLIYVEVDDKLLIDGIVLYTYTFGDVPKTVVDDFTSYRIPTREEVIQESIDRALNSIR